jgi:hypothetical protein
MYAAMKNLNSQQSSNPLTARLALIAVTCASPLFFVFALLGDPGKGRVALVCAAVTIIAVRSRWDLRERPWFWVTIATIIALHVPLVLLVRWPQNSYPGFTLAVIALPPSIESSRSWKG